MVLDFHKSYLLYKFGRLDIPIQASPVSSPIRSPKNPSNLEEIVTEEVEIANVLPISSKPLSPVKVPSPINIPSPKQSPVKVTEKDIIEEIERYIRANVKKLQEGELRPSHIIKHLVEKLGIDKKDYKQLIKDKAKDIAKKVEAELKKPESEKSESESESESEDEPLTDSSPSVDEKKKKKRKTKKQLAAEKESWSDNKLRDMVETLMEWILDEDTEIKDVEQESGIETLFYIFKSYYNSKGEDYEISDYIDFMNEFYNNPKYVYNPFVAKGKTAHTVAHSNKAAAVIKKYKNNVHKMSSGLKKVYEDKYDEFKKNRKHLYDIYEDEDGNEIIINPYSGLPSENKRFIDKYVACIVNADEELKIKGTKRKYYLYLCAMKIVKEKNQWKKTMNQICEVNEECTTKCCHKNKCASVNECDDKKKKSKKKKSKKDDVVVKDGQKDKFAPKKKKKVSKKKDKSPSLDDYDEISDVE